MKLPAIRGHIGIWHYYISSMRFSDIATRVKQIDNELHKSTTLSELIQRSITDNYKNIKNYILNQDERFFNSLVLAVYDGDPKWIEVQLDFEEDEEPFFSMGFLQLTGDEKIFPIDGQHRVEGIKAALSENPELHDEQIPVIFLGHRTDEDGMQRSRRLFSTLNRYAKPVSMRDIIALDEDDIVAIITRNLIENHPLFEDKRIHDSKTKLIPYANKTAFTSLITLYECNKIIFMFHKGLNAKKTNDYLKHRPIDQEISAFLEVCNSFWDDFSSNLDVITGYMDSNTDDNPAHPYRDNENGGNLLFRPIGLSPFISTIFDIKIWNWETPISDILSNFNNINLNLNQIPWISVLWNSVESKMLGRDDILVKKLLLYLYNKDILDEESMDDLSIRYRGKTGLGLEDIE